jgi:hypothetical protein
MTAIRLAGSEETVARPRPDPVPIAAKLRRRIKIECIRYNGHQTFSTPQIFYTPKIPSSLIIFEIIYQNSR